MPRDKPPVAKLSDLVPGQTADVFARLAEKTRSTTRDGKPFFLVRFADARRTTSTAVWVDAPLFAECDTWHAGGCYKVRGTFAEHEKYGPQLDLIRVREVKPEDAADGFREADFYPRSRFDSDQMFDELRAFAVAEVKDEPLIVGLLDAHADALKRLPASVRQFYPFPGGWLEHVSNVARSAAWLADRYVEHYPPLNRDLVIAGALLHDIGRVAELTVGPPGHVTEQTIPGRLSGHITLGRDLVRDAAKAVPDLNPELLLLLEHLILSHLSLPEWGSPRLPAIPEALILFHADDLDAKFEMYARCLTKDASPGPFTERDPVLGKSLLKGRSI
jgi:3'-5' exoribonuclease